MAKLLYLVHRLPYPPNKGDKVRSYHILKHLAQRHQVFLGTFIDDPADEVHVDRVRNLCAEAHIARLSPRRARLASASALWRGEPLTLAYYRDRSMSNWVREVTKRHDIAATVVFSSSMAQFAPVDPPLPMLVDFVDLDSAKWSAYAGEHRWPMSWVYRREGERLLAYERSVALRAKRSFFVTDKEAELFRRAAPDAAANVDHFGNGVDTEFFAPDPARPSPFSVDEIPLVFTGAMDYWPNIDAVTWFAHEVLPALRETWPALRLHIVGRSPGRAVCALAGERVAVTGTVADVRPYLQHAAVVVAPLRLARGIQNKILEAMAMARPVIASRACVDALEAGHAQGLIAADEARDYRREIDALLRTPESAAHLGSAARGCVQQRFTWDAHLARLDRSLPRA